MYCLDGTWLVRLSNVSVGVFSKLFDNQKIWKVNRFSLNLGQIVRGGHFQRNYVHGSVLNV